MTVINDQTFYKSHNIYKKKLIFSEILADYAVKYWEPRNREAFFFIDVDMCDLMHEVDKPLRKHAHATYSDFSRL